MENLTPFAKYIFSFIIHCKICHVNNFANKNTRLPPCVKKAHSCQGFAPNPTLRGSTHYIDMQAPLLSSGGSPPGLRPETHKRGFLKKAPFETAKTLLY